MDGGFENDQRVNFKGVHDILSGEVTRKIGAVFAFLGLLAKNIGFARI